MGSEQLKCLQGTRQKQCIKMLLSLEQLGLTRGFSVIDFLSTTGRQKTLKTLSLEWYCQRQVLG